jgi:hypothetical protein
VGVGVFVGVAVAGSAVRVVVGASVVCGVGDVGGGLGVSYFTG